MCLELSTGTLFAIYTRTGSNRFVERDFIRTGKGRRTMRILVVDDDRNVLSLVSNMLREMDQETCSASCVSEALGLIAELKFDIVLIDHNLGEVSGIELMAEIKNDSPDLCFILMTGEGTTELAVRSLKQGASDFLAKPFTMTDLSKSIDYVRKQIDFENEKKTLLAGLKNIVREKTQELERISLSVLATLAQAMEKRDFGTFGHSRRVCEYSSLISDTLGLDGEERDRLRTAALLHDIGKIGITDFIIGKSGALNREEMDVVRAHPRIGVEILSPLKQLEPILPSILYHHERYDGSGYPERLQGSHIPLHARIIAVADTYDAIMSDRPYRAAADHRIAIKELMAHAEKQFDPAIIKTFYGIEAAAIGAIRGMSAEPGITGRMAADLNDRGNIVAFAGLYGVFAGE